MPAKIIWFLILCLSFLAFPDSSPGQKANFHANPGVAFPKEKNILTAFESGFGFSLSLTKRIFLSINFGYWKSNVEEKEHSLLNGELSTTPFFLSLQFKLRERSQINPYVFVGTNLVFTKFEIGDYITIPEVTLNQKVRNGLGLHFGTGADFSFTEYLALFVEGIYLVMKAEAETTITDLNFGVSTEEFSVSLDSLIFQVGIKYFF
jgi:outer membrane protein W